MTNVDSYNWKMNTLFLCVIGLIAWLGYVHSHAVMTYCGDVDEQSALTIAPTGPMSANGANLPHTKILGCTVQGQDGREYQVTREEGVIYGPNGYPDADPLEVGTFITNKGSKEITCLVIKRREQCITKQ